MMRETIFVFLGTLVSLKLLYQFRSVPFIHQNLSAFVALVLIYFPLLHVWFRKLPVRFFERNLGHIFKSFKLFLIALVVVFPPFLVANHFYQKIFLGNFFQGGHFHLTLKMVLMQLFVVALPEEFFFRGYFQTILRRKYTPFVAIPVTSLLFAFSHSVIALQWWHFAIFFPSLVFGWLREKTGGLVAPILFHAVSNILVFWIGSAYR